MKALVCGAGGFIGHHLVNDLKSRGYWVRAADLKYPEFEETRADDFRQGDLRDPVFVDDLLEVDGCFDEVYQLAADMGGSMYIFSGENDANVMHNSALINLNVVGSATKHSVRKIFFSSSACIYPAYNQLDPDNPKCSEESAYPAEPDSEYGWEKIFSERMYMAYHRNYGLNVRVARFHNIFGPLGTWRGGKEKAPAAICRKVAEAVDGGSIEVIGDGHQTRSFLFIDECLMGIRKIMESDFLGPVNIGSEEKVSINELVDMVSEIAGKRLTRVHVPGFTGVRGRNSDNRLIQEKVGWAPSQSLREGLEKTYAWISKMVEQK